MIGTVLTSLSSAQSQDSMKMLTQRITKVVFAWLVKCTELSFFLGRREAERGAWRDSTQLVYTRCGQKYIREDCFSKKYHCEGNKNAG